MPAGENIIATNIYSSNLVFMQRALYFLAFLYFNHSLATTFVFSKKFRTHCKDLYAVSLTNTLSINPVNLNRSAYCICKKNTDSTLIETGHVAPPFVLTDGGFIVAIVDSIPKSGIVNIDYFENGSWKDALFAFTLLLHDPGKDTINVFKYVTTQRDVASQDLLHSIFFDVMLYRSIRDKNYHSLQLLDSLRNTFKHLNNPVTDLLLKDYYEDSILRKTPWIRKIYGEDLMRLYEIQNARVWSANIDSTDNMEFKHLIAKIKAKRPDLVKRYPFLFKWELTIPRGMIVRDSSLQPHSLISLLKSRITILYFWGSWCSACYENHTALVAKINKLLAENPNISFIPIAAENINRVSEWKSAVARDVPNFANYVSFSESKDRWSGPALDKYLQYIGVEFFPNLFVVKSDGTILHRNDLTGDASIEFCKKYFQK